jgi:hypothetical protein
VAIEELDWDRPGSQQRLEQLAAARPDYIIAADCVYIDEACIMPLPYPFRPSHGEWQSQQPEQMFWYCSVLAVTQKDVCRAA